MKTKILLVPLVITIIVALSIWLVYPAYSNGKNGVKEKYEQLKKEQKKLSNIQNKSANAQKLSSQLASLSDKNILYGFIPRSDREEEIIDNLNFLASSAGLSVLNFNPEQNTRLNNSDQSNQDSASESLPVAKTFKAKVEISGSYEAIKQFFGSVNKLSRYNDITILNIKKNVNNQNVNNQGENANVPANTLLADMEITFDILPQAKLSDQNVNDSIFSSSKLDTKIISKIKDARNTKVFQLDVGQKGKTNPFLP